LRHRIEDNFNRFDLMLAQEEKQIEAIDGAYKEVKGKLEQSGSELHRMLN